MDTPRAHAHRFVRRLLLAALFAAFLVPVARGGSATPDSFTPSEPSDPQVLRARLLHDLNVSAWHEAGCRGRGLKVAVLDSGFHGYRLHLGKGLPDHVTAKSFRRDEDLEARDSQHGVLCAEVVHTLAPEAELLLANWEPERPESFLAAVAWARAQGAKVISCSVIMPTWSDGEGHGVIHRLLAHLLGGGDGAGDLLCFASAGNTAQRHWSGTFHDDGHGLHQWLPGETDNVVRPWGADAVSVELSWQSGATYEAVVEDVTTGHAVARSQPYLSADHCFAVLRFLPQEGRAYRLRLRLKSGTAGRFHLVVLGGSLAYASRRGSIAFPADGPEVIAVGAVDHDGRRRAYSSCGPNSEAPKPDFVAEVPFPCPCRERPFAGTSAAAPQAAALAALVWCSHPEWTARQVREALKKAVRRLGAAEHDCDTGYGRIRLP
jgi:hypothetical protein